MIRTDGSYLYEDFLPTQGTDVKVYTVGPNYFHAEARKSPAVDGRVTRGSDGKEVRYPIILTAQEKEIAMKVTLAFKQVCRQPVKRQTTTTILTSFSSSSFSFSSFPRQFVALTSCVQMENHMSVMSTGGPL